MVYAQYIAFEHTPGNGEKYKPQNNDVQKWQRNKSVFLAIHSQLVGWGKLFICFEFSVLNIYCIIYVAFMIYS